MGGLATDLPLSDVVFLSTLCQYLAFGCGEFKKKMQHSQAHLHAHRVPYGMRGRTS